MNAPSHEGFALPTDETHRVVTSALRLKLALLQPGQSDIRTRTKRNCLFELISLREAKCVHDCSGAREPRRLRAAGGPFASASTEPVIRPLAVLPAEADLGLVRQDLLATAEERFGPNLVEEARANPNFLVVKRFVGMAPPPPPGAGADWAPVPAAILLIRREGRWLVVQANGWRPANADAAAELDRIIADPEFWSGPTYTPPCPDFGASLLLLKMPNHSETVRNSLCISRTSRIVEAALRA